MPPLPNQRHEKYCQNLFEGQPQNAAYEAAGYRYHEGNASRLRSNEKVVARLAELQAAAAKASEVTVESLLAELEHARSRADNLDQLSAAVKATSEKAKISGLLVQKVEVTNIDEFSDCNSLDDLADKAAHERGYQITDDQRGELVGLLCGWSAVIDEYLQRCAKPVPVITPPVNRRNLESIERQRLGLTHGNGRQR